MNDQKRWGRYRDVLRVSSFLRPRRRIARNSSAVTEKLKKIASSDDDLQGSDEQVTIRKAGSTDKAFVISLGKQLFEVYGPYGGAVSRWLDHETTSTFIAEVDRIRVGFIMLGALDHRWETPPSFELLAIGLSTSARRKGLGNRLMETVEKHAAQQGLDRIFLHTAVKNYPAQRLFYKRGYRPWGLKPRFYPAGQDALVMSKQILDPGPNEGDNFEA